MKDIHVLLLSYSNSTTLNQALTSLRSVHHRVEDITILEEPNLSLQINDPAITERIKCIKLIQNDLGITLNKYIQELSCEYVLFLYGEEYFDTKIKHIVLELHDNEYVMTYPWIVKGKVIQRPFFVKTSFLKQTNFFSKYQIPFKEAVLPSWLSKISKSFIVNTSGDFINKTSMNISADNLQKLNFIEKYRYILEQGFNQPSISVILSNYNMADYVGVAINSCFLQTTPPEKILVIDDGSTDNSYKKLEKWSQFSQFKLFQKENGGKARALNELLPHIETEFVIELDADDWFDPDAFSIIRRYLEVLPNDVAVLYGNSRHWRQTNSEDIKYRMIKKGKSVNNKHELLSYIFPLAPRIYRTSSLKKNNGFPIIEFEDGRMYEDVSVLNDLLKKNRLLYQDFTVYNVREHKSSITKKNKKSYSYWSNFKKNLE